MVVLMTAAAVWGVVQLFVLAWPARSVRLSTTLFAFALGVYGCGVAAALLELAYTRTIADQSGRDLAEVVRSTSYTVAPWAEEFIKIAPLLLIGLHVKVRRQWGVADFVVLGAALGAGFGLLESLLRYSLDAQRSLARDGGWIIPDSLSPPFVPGPLKVVTSWLPAPSGPVGPGQGAVATFDHLVWTVLAALGVGLLWRTRGGWRLLSVLPVLAAIACHSLNNYTVKNPGGQAGHWLKSLDDKAWAIPLICLAIAMVIDLGHLHRAKHTVPGVLLAAERADGDTLAGLIRYAAWRLPWSPLIALRFIRLRRSLFYAAAFTSPGKTEPLRRLVALAAARIDASDHGGAWRAADIRTALRAARVGTRRRWLLLIPALLALPSLLFLGVGSFKFTAGLQQWFTTGAGPRLLLWFAFAALGWVGCLLVMLVRRQRVARAQPLAEPLAVLRFRFAVALSSAAIAVLVLWRGMGQAGATGGAVPAAHLLEALSNLLVYLGAALFLASLIVLVPPGGLALAGGGAVAITAEAVVQAALLGTAGIVLAVVGVEGAGAAEDGAGDGGSENDGSGSSGGISNVSPEDLARVEEHLGRPELDHSPANDAMTEGIRKSMTEGRPLSEGEQNFMRHELAEARLMDGGMSYEDAHELALQTHPLMKNYTPEVIDRFPEMFNNNWRRAWGMEPR